MPNHYHLLISTPKANVSRAMRQVNGVYTQKINRKYKLEGALFKGRYKSIVIEENSYFKECIRYIHRNLRKAGLEKEWGKYPWTSHKSYIGKKSRLEWLSISESLGYFGKYEKTAINEYNRFVNENVSKELAKRLEGIKWPSVLGSDNFKDKIKRLFLGKDLSEVAFQEIKDALPMKSVEESRDIFLDYLKIPKEKYNKRHKDYYRVRDFAIRYCREKLNYKNVDLAKRMNLSVETISRAYRIMKDSKLYDKIIKKHLML